MRFFNIKALTALGVLAAMAACIDETELSTNSQSSAVDACAGAIVTTPSKAYVFLGTKLLIDEKDKIVRTFDGEYFGLYYDDGVIRTGDAQVVVEGVYLDSLPICEVNAIVDPSTGEITVESSSSEASTPVPASSAIVDPLTGDTTVVSVPASSADTPKSSGGQNPSSANSSAGGDGPAPASATSSAGGDTPASSPAEPASSSVDLDENGFPTLESYGPPSPEYTKDISNSGKRGWNTRYWDACKPHCSWISNGDKGRTDTTTNESYVAGLTTARNCNIHDVEIPTFTLGNVTKYWFGYEGTSSACENSNAGGAFTCTDMAPIAVNDTLSYGYVAGTADGKCGKCYHLQYDGHFEAESENNKPKETHQALKGKHMIVMASNIGMDVAGGNDKLPAGQFDLMVPGGGVGAFDALSTQVNGQNIEWGAGFGGFLTYCQQQSGYDAPMATYQKCVKDMCDAAFGNAGLPNLLRGCHWFADWFMAADNPTYYIEEVECPQYLMDHYLTRINTTKDNNYKKVTDWSNFKEGDVLDTLHCWKAGEGPADENGWANPNAGCNSGK